MLLDTASMLRGGRREPGEDGVGIGSHLAHPITPSIQGALIIVEDARVAAAAAALVLVGSSGRRRDL